ncbi:unnamed protein product [Phaeothamnion confervicola]
MQRCFASSRLFSVVEEASEAHARDEIEGSSEPHDDDDKEGEEGETAASNAMRADASPHTPSTSSLAAAATAAAASSTATTAAAAAAAATVAATSTAEVDKFNAAVEKYADEGAWRKAVVLLGRMRASGLTPSVDAYAAAIAALRRAVEPNRAGALLGDLFDACLPEDLLAANAAPDPTHEESSQTARVFALLVDMRRDGIDFNADTYRAVMGLCNREKLWQLALLLMEHARRGGVAPGRFMYDALCSTLESCGRPELSDAVFESALDEGVFDPWIGAAGGIGGGRIAGSGGGTVSASMDLHNFTVNTARAAVRVTLLDMAAASASAVPGGGGADGSAETGAVLAASATAAAAAAAYMAPARRPVHDPALPLNIVTGIGKHSEEGVAVIKPAILEMLDKEVKLEAQLLRHNQGCIVVRPAALRTWLGRTLEAGGKSVPARIAGAAAGDGAHDGVATRRRTVAGAAATTGSSLPRSGELNGAAPPRKRTAAAASPRPAARNGPGPGRRRATPAAATVEGEEAAAGEGEVRRPRGRPRQRPDSHDGAAADSGPAA